MSDDTRRQGFAASVARQARGLSLDAVRVLDRIASRLVQREQRDLRLTPETLAVEDQLTRDPDHASITTDQAIALVAILIASEDQERERAHEAARDEMVPRVSSSSEAAEIQAEARAQGERIARAARQVWGSAYDDKPGSPATYSRSIAALDGTLDATDTDQPIGVHAPGGEGG